MNSPIDDLAKYYAQKLYDENPKAASSKELIIEILTATTARVLKDLAVGKLQIPGYTVITQEQNAINDEVLSVSRAAGYSVDKCHRCQRPCVYSNDDHGECDDCSRPTCRFCNDNPSLYECPAPEDRDSSSD